MINLRTVAQSLGVKEKPLRKWLRQRYGCRRKRWQFTEQEAAEIVSGYPNGRRRRNPKKDRIRKGNYFSGPFAYSVATEILKDMLPEKAAQIYERAWLRHVSKRMMLETAKRWGVHISGTGNEETWSWNT